MSKSIAKLQARVESLSAQLVKAQEALNAASAIATVEVGMSVAFKYGRGETAVTKFGVVVATKVAESGVTMVAIESGEGFDKVVVRVPATAVISTNPDLCAPAADAPVEGAAEVVA